MRACGNSRTRTVAPRSSNRRTRWLPIKPAPPVTSTSSPFVTCSPLLVQIQITFAGNQPEHVANLVESRTQKEIGVAPVTLCPQDEEAGFHGSQSLGLRRGNAEKICAGKFQQTVRNLF